MKNTQTAAALTGIRSGAGRRTDGRRRGRTVFLKWLRAFEFKVCLSELTGETSALKVRDAQQFLFTYRCFECVQICVYNISSRYVHCKKQAHFKWIGLPLSYVFLIVNKSHDKTKINNVYVRHPRGWIHIQCTSDNFLHFLTQNKLQFIVTMEHPADQWIKDLLTVGEVQNITALVLLLSFADDADPQLNFN